MLFCASDAALAQEMHGQRLWQRATGAVFAVDSRLQLLNLAHRDAVRVYLASL